MARPAPRRAGQRRWGGRAAGAGDAAHAVLDAQDSGPPTTAARGVRSLADGLLLTLNQPFSAAIGRLGQSLTGEPAARGVPPDTPAALVTLAALHGGDGCGPAA